MVITIEDYENARVHTVKVKNRKQFWARMFDIQQGLGLKNIADLVRKEIMGIFSTNNLTKKQTKNYKCYLQEITKDAKDDSRNKYVRSDLMEKIIKNCRGVEDCKKSTNKEEVEKQRQNFRFLFGFKENDLFITKEESVLNKIMKAFSREEIYLQFPALNYKIDAWFPEYKLVIEVDELGQNDRNDDKEKAGENSIKQKLQCEFIRINPDREEYDIIVEIGKIYNHVRNSVEEKVNNNYKENNA